MMFLLQRELGYLCLLGDEVLLVRLRSRVVGWTDGNNQGKSKIRVARINGSQSQEQTPKKDQGHTKKISAFHPSVAILSSHHWD